MVIESDKNQIIGWIGNLIWYDLVTYFSMQLITYILLLSSIVQYQGLVVYINLKSHHVTQVSKSFKYWLLICFTVATLLVIYTTSVNKGNAWTKSGQHTAEIGLEGSYKDHHPSLRS